MNPIKFLDDIGGLKEFRDRYVKEEREKTYQAAFEQIAVFARVIATMPSYLNDVMLRNAPLEEKERHVRMILDLIDKVKADQVERFNELIYKANRIKIDMGGPKNDGQA